MSAEDSIGFVFSSDVQKQFELLDDSIQRKMRPRALRAGAKILLAAAKRNAPILSGALQRSLKIRAAKSKKEYSAINIGSGEAWFKGDEYYGAFIEFGWKTGARRLSAGERSRKASSKVFDELNNKTGIELQKAEPQPRGSQKQLVRHQVAGEHFVQYAYEEQGNAAIDAIEEQFVEDLGAAQS